MDTKLHTAVRYGNVNAVLEALKEGLNPNDIGLFKWSPIHEAANNGERDILKLLVAYNGNVNLQDKLHGNTPLHYAAREDNSACVTVLLKAGARINIKNYEGITCLDEATPLSCEIIMQFMNSRNAGSEWKDEKNDYTHNRNMDTNGVRIQNEWSHVGIVPEQAAIGQLHLSFEYQQLNLKIRVWQVGDLLLPPPQISMIDSIFVRGYLIPDPAKKTRRQTEYVRVETLSKDSSITPHSGIQHIFSSSSFRFETPLLYTGVTQNIIAERSVQLEVCMTQKHSHKAFLMAMFSMPLHTAVRHPIREKYPLIPCMNHTIPNNMRVYSARDIIFDNSSSSSQSPSRSTSVHSSFGYPLSVRGFYSQDVDVEEFLRRASLELSDSDDDVESSHDNKSSLIKSLASSAGTVDALSVSTDNEDSPGFQNGSHHSTATGAGNKEKTKPKKKIIPDELLVWNSSSEKEITSVYRHEGTDLTAKEGNQSRPDIRTTSHENGLVTGSGHAEEKSDSQITLKETNNVKKKIIPPEFLSKNEKISSELEKQAADHNSNHGDVEYETYNHSCIYDDIQSDNKDQNSPSAVYKTCQREGGKGNDLSNLMQAEGLEDIDVVTEVSHSIQRAGETQDTGPSSTPVSRPETPIWDFYDFTLEEGAQSTGDGADAQTDSVKDDATIALGTLQESILRLSSASKTLDTCRVSGPVLPIIMMEEFEMDDENDDDET